MILMHIKDAECLVIFFFRSTVKTCRGHPTVGWCEKYITGFTFDSVTQQCTEFAASGCNLSGNGFASIEACNSSCNKTPYRGMYPNF